MRTGPGSFPAVATLMRGLQSGRSRGWGLAVGVDMLGGVTNLVAVVLTIRHLSPEAFGVLTLTITTMQLVGALSNLGLNETLMTLVSRADAAARADDVARTLSAVLRLRLIVTGVVLIAGVVLSGPITGGVFRAPELALPFLLGVLGACGVSLSQFGLTSLRAFRSFGRYAGVSAARYVVVLGGTAALVATDRLDLTTALAVNVGAPYAAFVASLFTGKIWVVRGARDPLGLLPGIWSFSKWVIVSNLCSAFFSRLEIYLLTALASATELGIYSAAFRLCGGFVLLEGGVRTVLFPEVSRLGASPALAARVRRYTGALALLAVVLWILGLAASPLIAALLGSRYAAAVPVFLVVSVSRVALISLVPLGLSFFATDRTRAGAMFGVVQLAVLAATGLILIPAWGAMGAAWTNVVVTAAGAAYLAVAAWPALAGSRPRPAVSAADG